VQPRDLEHLVDVAGHVEQGQFAPGRPHPLVQADQLAQHGAGQPEIILNEKGAYAAYSNFARVTATPEEVILDFGLNPNPFLQGRQEVQVTQRLIMNHYTAKRLCSALLMTLQRHEATFGSIELDVRRRAHMPPPGAAPGYP
jgi:hypothetical protein